MSNPELDKLISDTEKYLQNVKTFYPFNIYIEKDIKPAAVKQYKEPIVEDVKVKYDAAPVEEIKPETKVVIEKDLFGNEVTVKEEWEFAETLEQMNEKICNCQNCALGATRTKFVFGVGNPNADIVLVGEAPGADEDKQGFPFVGRAGQLLNQILAAVELKREEVYICNILKCRPPGNRNPLPEEIVQCEPYLKHQLNLIKPKLILALGKFAADTLLNLNQPLNKMRGKIHHYSGIKTMVTYHPAALLRNQQWKRPTWEDMKQFKKLYDEIKK
ncbi:MAG: uracil-DNA glycosylase [Ignavibacteriae bacterium]|nr:MAG: uracil-DNA glycosylase [Ignavibacteriota bacterium]